MSRWTRYLAVLPGMLLLAAPSHAQPATVYVSMTGNDGNNGQSPATAVRTVARGIALAAPSGEVRIGAGIYDEAPVRVPGSVTLSGGWSRGFEAERRRVFTDPELREALNPGFYDKVCETATCLTGARADRVVVISADDGIQPRRLSNLIVLAPSPSGAGASSYGIVADRAPVDLDRVIVHGGTAGPGGTGERGQPGAVGQCTRGGQGGSIRYTFYACDTTNPTKGDDVLVNGVIVARGGAGGPEPYTSCGLTMRMDDPPPGNPGDPGDPGQIGARGGAADDDKGVFVRPSGTLQWQAGAPGRRGGNGGPGAGGGGGSWGGTVNYLYWWGCNQTAQGGAGGGGGQAGCGGNPGSGGASGASSFGLVLADAVATGTHLSILIGAGGIGGTGGNGGDGGGGGGGSGGGYGTRVEGCGDPHHVAGRGGLGGQGGEGGAGGGGAGGNGGHAVAVALIGNSHLRANLLAKGGKAGTGGAGGRAGTNGTHAESGRPGLHFTNPTPFPLK